MNLSWVRFGCARPCAKLDMCTCVCACVRMCSAHVCVHACVCVNTVLAWGQEAVGKGGGSPGLEPGRPEVKPWLGHYFLVT